MFSLSEIVVAHNTAMLTTALLFVLGFYLVSLVAFAINVRRAPQGYQDAEGFHFGLTPAKVILARRRPVAAPRTAYTF